MVKLIRLGIERLLPIEVKKAALGVRRWCLKHKEGENIPHRIKGCCKSTSERLALQMEHMGYHPKVMCNGDFNCGAGKNIQWRDHWFIIWRECILDITGDQFNPLLQREKALIRVGPIVFDLAKKWKNKLYKYRLDRLYIVSKTAGTEENLYD